MKIVETPIHGLLLIEPRVFGDERGFFLESWNERDFSKAVGLDTHFVQDNHSRSARGVLRGLHYQQRYPQGKLVRVVSGCVWDVAVDLRRGSQSFGQSFGCELSAENHRQLWIPEGFAHGFQTLEDNCELLYFHTVQFEPQSEGGLNAFDPRLGIEWPLAVSERSPRDQQLEYLTFEFFGLNV